jgi:quercetin dioxygenase-like cupin family protein
LSEKERTMTSETPPAGEERALEPLTGPWLLFDLDDEVRRLGQEEASHAGRNAKTLVKHPDFRVVLTTLMAGSRIRGHRASGRISIQTIRGHIRMRVSQTAAENTIDLPAGHVLVLDRGIYHDVQALVDSSFLLTIAWPQAAAGVLASVAPPSAT